jgi:predicted amidohydrolase YtcJ
MSLGLGIAHAQGLMPADVVVTDARIYTARPQRGMAEALAIKNGNIAFVGSAADAKAWVGPHTQVVRLKGKLVLPGLFDSHVHPIEIIDADVCNLDSHPQKTLSNMSAFVHACALKYKLPAGQWLKVYQWNYTAGNEPDARFTTLRAALDKAAPHNPVELFGNDGHHGAFNSMALGPGEEQSRPDRWTHQVHRGHGLRGLQQAHWARRSGRAQRCGQRRRARHHG